MNVESAYTSDGAASSQERKRWIWHAALLAVTLTPLLGLPLASSLQLPFRDSFLIGLAVFVGGVCHVASTSYFYLDKDARALMRGMKGRFVALPLAVVALSAAALVAGDRLGIADDAVLAIFCVHLIWLYYHYQKQNYGLLAFAAASGGARMPHRTVAILLLAPVAGGLATIPQLLSAGLGRDLGYDTWLPVLHSAGVAVYAVGALLLAGLIAHNRALFTRPLVAAFTATGFLFFLPALLVEDIDYAFWSYAIAHGLQYLLMVGIVSAQARRLYFALPVFLAAAVSGGWMLDRFAGNHALFICGIALTWVHFVLDAKLWRMSEPAVRQFLRSRFAFVLR